MKKLSSAEKKQALENALKSYGFAEKYFIYPTGYGRNERFGLATKNETGGIDSHSRYMEYEEFNCFLQGYNAAKLNKY